jgi:hypothetical protein
MTLTGAAIVIALVFALGTGVAGAAKGGNSANAKKCQGTGYLDWVDANGNAFASADACTAYAAKKGNALQPKPVRTWQSVCEDELDPPGQYLAGDPQVCRWGSVSQAFANSANEALLPFCPGAQSLVFVPPGPSLAVVLCNSASPT